MSFVLLQGISCEESLPIFVSDVKYIVLTLYVFQKKVASLFNFQGTIISY